jgi:chemotaxis family two-component system response regulator Rcp1
MKKRSAAPAEAVRILLIEDNAADVDLMRYALDKGHFPYELRTLPDGAEALAFIRREGKYAHAAQPGLIVMDLHLPKNDGMEVLEEIRGNAEFADLPVAVLSSSVSPEEKNSIAALRATCLIPKPSNLDAFLNVGERIKQMALERNASATAP